MSTPVPLPAVAPISEAPTDIPATGSNQKAALDAVLASPLPPLPLSPPTDSSAEEVLSVGLTVSLADFIAGNLIAHDK